MSEFQMHWEGLTETEQALARLYALLVDLRPLWPRVVPLFIGWMREQFATEGEWGGDPWAPLTEAYAVYKASKYPGKSLLIAEGDLRQSASRPHRVATPRTLELSFTGEGEHHGAIAGYFQKGTSRMVARPLVPEVLPLSAERELQEVAYAYTDEMVAQLGLAH